MMNSELTDDGVSENGAPANRTTESLVTGVTLRDARQEDCPRLMELIHELAIYEHSPEEVTVTMEEFADAGFGTSPVWKAFVAEYDGQIAGFALYYTRYSTWKGRRLYLEDFLVTNEQRGKGIGKLLFDRVLQEAREQNFSGMTWQVLDWNTPAINFYAKYGTSTEAGWLNASLSSEQLDKIEN